MTATASIAAVLAVHHAMQPCAFQARSFSSKAEGRHSLADLLGGFVEIEALLTS